MSWQAISQLIVLFTQKDEPTGGAGLTQTVLLFFLEHIQCVSGNVNSEHG